MTRRILSLALLAVATLGCTHHALDRGPSPVTTIPTSQLVLADSMESRGTTHEFPRYPYAAQTQGVSARLVAFFVVDTVGHVDIRSVRFGLDADRLFYAAVCDALTRMRFAPIRRDGQARPALVVLPYSFTIGDGAAGGRALVPDPESFRRIIRAAGMDSTLISLARRPRC